jgi:hypothetical protein
MLEIIVQLLKLGMLTGLWLVGVWVGGAIITAWVAAEKQRSPTAWLVIALLLSPLLALVALGAVPAKEAAEARVRHEPSAATVRRLASGW